MRFFLGGCLTFATSLGVPSVAAAAASDSGIFCPLVGPTPPTKCDGRDGLWFPVSVVGRGAFCALGPEVCVADQLAACPGPSTNLPYGSKCVQLETHVYGCKPKSSCTDGDLGLGPDSATCDGGCAIDATVPQTCDGSNGWSPVSVVKSGTFCAKGPVCRADQPDACPGPQHGLPFGSSCVRMDAGVFGCVKNTKCASECASTPSPTPTAADNHDLCGTADHDDVPSVTPTSAATTTAPTLATASPTSSTPAPPATTTAPTTTAPPAAATAAPTNAPTAAPTTTPTTTVPTTGSDPIDDDNNVSLLPVPNLTDTFTLDDLESEAAPSPATADIPTLSASGGRRVRRVL